MTDKFIETSDYRGPDRRKKYVLELSLHDAKALAFMLGRIIDNHHVPQSVRTDVRAWLHIFSERCETVEVGCGD